MLVMATIFVLKNKLCGINFERRKMKINSVKCSKIWGQNRVILGSKNVQNRKKVVILEHKIVSLCQKGAFEPGFLYFRSNPTL